MIVKWVVELLGDEVDLRNARTLFASGKIRVETIENNITALIEDEFESLTRSSDVSYAASSLIDFVNGSLFLSDSERIPLRIGTHIYESRNGDGTGKVRILRETKDSGLPACLAEVHRARKLISWRWDTEIRPCP